jgi:hypothetical protein
MASTKYNFKSFKEDFKQLSSYNEDDFNRYFSNNETDLLCNFFFQYFGEKSTSDLEFLKRLIPQNTSLLIKAIRVHQVAFLRYNHWETIQELSRLTKCNELVQWVAVLNLVKDEEKHLWEDIEAKVNSLLAFPADIILTYASWWIESKRMADFDSMVHNPGITGSLIEAASKNIETREDARKALEVFLSYFFTKCNNIHLIKRTLENTYMERYIYLLKEWDNDSGRIETFEVLDEIYAWQLFNVTVVDVISYDLNYNVRQSSIGYSLYPKSILNYTNWQLDGLKYGVSYNHFIEFGKAYGNDLIEKGDVVIPRANDSFWGHYNKEMFLGKLGIAAFANEYCIDGFDVDSDGEIDIPIRAFIDVFSTLQINAKARCIDVLDNFYTQGIQDYRKRLLLQFLEVIKNQKGNVTLRDDELNDWYVLVKDLLEDTPVWNENQGALHLETVLVCDTSKLPSHFNRFKPYLSLTSKPFLKVKDYIFSFSNILGELNWGVSVVQNALEMNLKHRTKIAKQETVQMEKKLAEAFIEAGFNNVANSCEYTKTNDGRILRGDIDLVVYESGVLLIGELKRTKLRLDLKEAWLEDVQTNNKAVGQLEKHKNLIDSNPEVIRDYVDVPSDIEVSEIQKVYVIISTSFERDGQLFGTNNDIQKISHYEVNRLLEGMNTSKMYTNKLNPLEELIKMFKCRWIWQQFSMNESMHCDDLTIAISSLLRENQ